MITGQLVIVWFKPGVTKSGQILEISDNQLEVLVRFDNNLPDEWVKVSQLV